jgi:hypothetical protein
MCVSPLSGDAESTDRTADFPGCVYEAGPRLSLPRRFARDLLSPLVSRSPLALNLSVDARYDNLISHLPEDTSSIRGLNMDAANASDSLVMGRVILSAFQTRSQRRRTSLSAFSSAAMSTSLLRLSPLMLLSNAA